jgi:hypothetical protein
MICNCRLRGFSINDFLMRDQYLKACGNETLGTIACCIIMNQNSNSRHGLLTPAFFGSVLSLAGAWQWISPGGKKFGLMIDSFNQQGHK